jgi:predicted nucleic acid-binding protein
VLRLLDTSTCSALMRHELQTRSRLESSASNDEAVLCVITRGEILHGIERLPTGRRRSALEAEAAQLFSEVRCVPVPREAADIYAHLKVTAIRCGVQLDENDLWIAATAGALDATLVAADKDFGRLPELRVENWSE